MPEIELETENKETLDNEKVTNSVYMDLLLPPEGTIDINYIMDSSDFIERNIYIDSEVDSQMAVYIHHLIYIYNKLDKESKVENRKPIKIFLNSDGGELDACRTIISSMLTSKTPIYTINIGKAYSCAFWILICGKLRYGYPYSSYLCHKGSINMLQETTNDFFRFSNQYKDNIEEFKDLIYKFTAEPDKICEQYEQGDFWCNSNTALKLGVIDKIADNIDLEDDYNGNK